MVDLSRYKHPACFRSAISPYPDANPETVERPLESGANHPKEEHDPGISPRNCLSWFDADMEKTRLKGGIWLMSSGKETERTELHKTIWRLANDLRGSVDGWDFKSYVLGMLFYRFISENLTGYLNEQEHKAGYPDFDYARLSDSDAISVAENFDIAIIGWK